jgi:hypothetical protein
VAAGVWLWNRQSAAERTSPRHLLPWSILLQEGRQLQVVFADPDISAMQELVGWQISLSDYANRRYVANPEALGSDMQRALRILRGHPLGGMIRFSAHPHLMNSAEPNAYATDYCGPARRWLDKARGGIHLFAEGPQGNLVPRETVEFVGKPGKPNWADSPYGPDGSLVAVSTDELRRSVWEMGESLSRHACDSLQRAEFKPLKELVVRTRWVDLPMRNDVPDNSKGAWEIRDDWGKRISQALRDGVSLIEMKRMTDQYNRFHWMKKMLDE